MNDSAYLDQACQNVRLLISRGLLNDAQEKLKKLEQDFPQSQKITNLKKDLQSCEKQKIEEEIREEVAKFKPLWKAKKYSEILRNLRPLLEESPNNKELQDQFKKAKELYEEQIAELQLEFYQKQNERLKELLEKRPEDLPQEIYNLEQANPDKEEVKKITQELKDRYIDKQIKDKEALLKSTSFSEINELVNRLTSLSPQNEKLIKLKEQTKERQICYELNKQSEHYKNSIAKLKALEREKKYDELLIATNELQQNYPEKPEFKKWEQKAENYLYKTSKATVVKEIKKQQGRLVREFKAKPNDFLRL